MRNDDVRKLTYMAVIIALTVCATILIRIPIPATQGYVHLGDTILFLAVMVIGKKRGAVSGAIGQSIADLIGGYAIFAPVTFVAKILMGLFIGIAIEKITKYRKEKHNSLIFYGIILIIVSCITMVGIYFFAESAIYGGFVIPLVEIPANIIEFSVSLITASFVGTILDKSSAKVIFNNGGNNIVNKKK